MLRIKRSNAKAKAGPQFTSIFLHNGNYWTIRLPPQKRWPWQPCDYLTLQGNKGQWIERVTDNSSRTVVSNAWFSASSCRNNFPHIKLLIEVRSVNYSLRIVYFEAISSFLLFFQCVNFPYLPQQHSFSSPFFQFKNRKQKISTMVSET